MALNNIILLILLILIIGIIVYFYYNYKNFNITKKYDTCENSFADDFPHRPESNNNIKKKSGKNNKHVRFNNKIKYNVYNKLYTSSDLTSPYLCSPVNKSKINVDDIFLSTTSENSSKNRSEDPRLDKLSSTNPEKSMWDIDISQDFNKSSSIQDVCPMNLEQSNPNELWDANFGLPLMDKEEKKKFFAKMQKNHEEYGKSLGQFTKYQTDDSTIIKTDTTIDPFKPNHRSDALKNCTVKEIYDEQVKGPQAKPKRIKSKSSTSVIYEDESEMNGGNIKGTNLYGYDGINDEYKSAAFENEF